MNSALATASNDSSFEQPIDAPDSLTVILADDDELDRVVTKRLLRGCGLSITVIECATGSDAIQTALDDGADLLLLDYSLPDMTGNDVLLALADEGATALPVIVLTGAGNETVAAQLMRNGADDYLPKHTLSATNLAHAVANSMRRASLCRSLERKQNKLTQTQNELDEFLQVASHDLREPLRTISSFAHLVDERYAAQLDEKGKQFLRFICDGAQRMLGMVDGLASLSRLGHSDETFAPYDVSAIAGEAMANLQALTAETGATVHLASLPNVLCERNQILTLLQNLIANAVRHNDRSPPQVSIAAKPISISAEDRIAAGKSLLGYRLWQFSVEDNGPGIEPRHRERVFEMFERVSNSNASGRGMGLAICRRIVQNHGGRIWVDDADSGGARFCFTLPQPEPR